MKLWKYNKITGYWMYIRDVSEYNKSTWLYIYQKDEPNEKFKISKNKPR
jgi:hypothetical protein